MIRRRFPLFRQLDSIDCGPACLKMICTFYHKDVTMTDIKDQFKFYNNGVNMLDLSIVAESLGFRTLSLRLTLDQFIENAILPCIVYYHHHHFIVVFKVSTVKNSPFFYVADPASGIKKLSLSEFEKGWRSIIKKGVEKGHCLLLQPQL